MLCPLQEIVSSLPLIIYANVFKKCKEFARSCDPIERLRIGPVMIVVLTVPDSIGSVVKHD